MIFPDALNRTFAQDLGLGNPVSITISRSTGLIVVGRIYPAGNIRFIVQRFPTSTGCDVPYRINALLADPVSPQSNGGSLHTKNAIELNCGFSMVGLKDDSASQDDLLGCGSSGGQLFEPMDSGRFEFWQRFGERFAAT